MTEPRDHDEPDARLDRQLSELLSDAVSDVEPANALDTIRNRTKVTPMSSRRPWLLAAGGAVVATAAVITAIALAGGNLPGTTADDDPDPVGQTSRTPDPSPSESGEPDPADPTTTAPSEGSGSGSGPVPVYFVSETPQGLRLFREFQAGVEGDPLLASAVATVEGDTLDPDYRSLWPSGSSVDSVVSDGADVLTVDIVGAPRELPSGMTQADAQLAVQQVIYSVQAANGQGRVGVQLLLDGGRTDQVLGQPTSEPLANAPVGVTISTMNITFPGEGDSVSGSFTAYGVNNAYEATFTWQILDGQEVVAEGFGTAKGCCEVDKLYEWEAPDIDVAGLEPGAYTFVASNSDPSGGAEGGGPHVDTRVFVVE